MKKRVIATAMMFSLVLTMVFSFAVSVMTAEAKSPWGGDDMDDWPLAISCDPEWPLFGPEVGETREEVVSGLQKGNKITSYTIKNYSPKIVKIVKKKKTSSGLSFKIKGKKKGYAHIKVVVKLKIAQNEKKKYVWNIKKYPVGHND